MHPQSGENVFKIQMMDEFILLLKSTLTEYIGRLNSSEPSSKSVAANHLPTAIDFDCFAQSLSMPIVDSWRNYFSLLSALLNQQALQLNNAIKILEKLESIEMQVKLQKDVIDKFRLEQPVFSAKIKELVSQTFGFLNHDRWVRQNCLWEFDVLFVTHDSTTRGHVYRVIHPCYALNQIGVRANWINLEAMSSELIHKLKVKSVVLFRCEYSDDVSGFIDACHGAGVGIVYDIDDLLFDSDVVEKKELDFLNGLSKLDFQRWVEKSASIKKLISKVQRVSVPTKYLRDSALRHFKHSAIFPNTFDLVNRAMCDAILKGRRSLEESKVTLGYASGTATHEQDFLQIKSVLLRLLEQHSNLRIKIVGFLDCINGLEFEPFRARIKIAPCVPLSLLPLELLEFDINLIPLQVNRFTNGKSELKYFEAALLEIPSVCINNSTYNSIVTHGDNGLLADSELGWCSALNKLVEDQAFRLAVGKSARATALEFYDIESLGELYANQILEMR